MQEYRLRDIIRCELLPKSEMILSMSKEFGIPLTEKETALYKYTEKKPEENANDKENLNPINSKFLNDFDNVNITNIPHTSRIWTPIDNANDNFMIQKKERETQNNRNYLIENIQQIPEISERNRYKRPIKRYITADSAFNYSSQALNSTELALNKFREYINEVNDLVFNY